MSKLRYSGKLLREFFGLAREKRSYWIVPLVILLFLAALVVAGGQAAAPLLYTLF